MEIFKTIAIIGKSTVPQNNPSYKFSEQLAYDLVSSGYAIRHGGYAGGIMQAVSNGASKAIAEHGFNHDRNIGIPEVRFDSDSERTSGKFFLDAAKDICDRLRGVVLESDYIVVAPRGGDGTMLELQLAIHENTLGKYTGIIRPIILCELPGETPWSKIVNRQLADLDNGIKNIADCGWVHVVHSVEEVKNIIN